MREIFYGLRLILDSLSFALPDMAFIFTEGLGFAGAILIGYTLVSRYTSVWEPLERVAAFLSALLTILGALVTALSIYLPITVTHAPWPYSRYFVSPVVVASCVAALWFLIRFKTLPPILINGFALLAISGGLKRLLPNPHF